MGNDISLKVAKRTWHACFPGLLVLDHFVVNSRAHVIYKLLETSAFWVDLEAKSIVVAGPQVLLELDQQEIGSFSPQLP